MRIELNRLFQTKLTVVLLHDGVALAADSSSFFLGKALVSCEERTKVFDARHCAPRDNDSSLGIRSG